MAFAMAGTFLASDGLLYYIFWELSIPFISLPSFGVMVMLKNVKKCSEIFYLHPSGSLFMLIAFVYLYQQAKFLLEDLYKLNLSATEQLWIFLAFFLAYAIKIPLIPFHTWQQMCTKAPAVGTMLLSELCLKWDCIVLFNCLSLHLQQRGTCIFISLGMQELYGSILALHKRLKVTRLLLISPRWVNCSGDYTLTIDGLRGAVLQMIAHGFVVVGLFSSLTSF
jgi:NADH-quinone oxidoreductase subunit M